MSSPYTLSSRWWTFTVTGFTPDEITRFMIKAKPAYAQWWLESEAIVGYVFFTSARYTPKKPWIFTGDFAMSTKDKIHSTLSPAKDALSFGRSGCPIDWAAASTKVISEEYNAYIKEVSAKQLVKTDEEPKLRLKYHHYKLPNGNILPKAMLEAMLDGILANPPDIDKLDSIASLGLLEKQTIGLLSQIISSRGIQGLLTVMVPSRPKKTSGKHENE